MNMLREFTQKLANRKGTIMDRILQLTHTIRLVLIAFVVMIGMANAQDDTDPNALAAQNYAAAYLSQDTEGMAKLLADDAQFKDPSNSWQGKEAIIEGMEGVFKRITGSGPDGREIRRFRSGNDFIFGAWADFNMLLTVGEKPETEYNFKLDFLMILTAENGKIVEHRDYVDTDAFDSQMQSQIAAASSDNETE